MINKLDGQTFKDMVIAASARVAENREAINGLNVFPVPDGDTGTNMSLTIKNAETELLKKEPKTISEACDITASALLRGARGNSGVILSLLFRGFAKAMKEKTEADASEVAAAFAEGVSTAYKAVMKPAEGTILTVSRLAAAAAGDAAEGGADLEAVFAATIKSGESALTRTIDQNPVLKKAGVIDAGGKGYMHILNAMFDVLKGDAKTWPIVGATADEPRKPLEKAVFSDFATDDITYAYCTEFIVERSNDKDPNLLWSFLGEIGDSIVVVDDEEIIKVHVHNNCPGVVLTEALTYGSLATVKIENMRLQHTDNIELETQKAIGVVAVCAGKGLEGVFRELGADGIISGGQTMNPSTEDILSVIEKIPAETVFILPNNKNIIMAAEQCDALTNKKVIVIPTATVPQGISAMIAFDTDVDVDNNREAMSLAYVNTHTLSITYAARDSIFDGISMKAGDYLVLLEGKLLTTGSNMDDIIPEITKALSSFDPACITVYYGENVKAGDAEAFAGTIAEKIPDAEVQTLSGEQPVYYYLISAE